MKKIKFSCLSLAIIAFLGLTANLHADDKTATNSTEAVLQHSGFHEGLVWIGKEPNEQENARLLQIIGDLNKPVWRSEVEKFFEDFPESPWAASLHYAYASVCHSTGRTTKALEHWEAGWNLVKNDTSANGRRLGGEILAHWSEQLSSLGRRDKLRELIPVGDQWPFANRQDRERFQSAKNNYHLMGKHPEISYRCGTLALKAVGQALQPTNQALQSLVEIGSPIDGFSMSGLGDLAKQYGLDLVAVRRTEGQDLIVPSVIHWRQNHYAAILKQDGKNYLVNDPTFGKPRWMQQDAINEEASGFFLIPASKQTSHWQTIGSVELASIHGKGLYNSINDALDKGCTTVAGGAQECNCGGMPVWWISEPYNNLWIADEPLSYLTSRGEPFTFRFTYKQRGTGPSTFLSSGTPGEQNSGVANTGWNHTWLSFIELISNNQYDYPFTPAFYYTLEEADATLYLPNGGQVDFPSGTTYDPETRLLIQPVDSTWESLLPTYGDLDDGDDGLRIVHADGSQDIYGYVLPNTITPNDHAVLDFLLSRHIDPHGDTTWLYYTLDTNDAHQELFEVQYVVDSDGRTNTFSYTYNSSLQYSLLASVTNAYGASAHFSYDTNGNLTTIVDAQGLSSAVAYDTNGYPTSLTTPYGTNTFALYENAAATSTNVGDGNFGTDSPPYVDRAEVITDPTGGTHLYLYQFDCADFMPTNYLTADVPTNTPLGTLDAGTGSTNSISGVNFRNSFAWNARQYAALSTTNFLSLSTNDYLLGRMKHWLQDTNNLYVSEYLSVQRDPSPDGTTAGLMTFYDYQGKPYSYQAGTNPVPSVTAWCLPGGETHYEYVQYDYFGNVTNRVTTYTTASSTLGTRTNQYFYANNVYTNIFYAPYADSNGVYDIYLPLSTNTVTVPNLLTRVVEANGSNVWTFGSFDVVSRTNFFNADGETNEIVYSSQRVLPDFATNGLNQTTAFTFTAFDKITSIQWPAGLTTTNIYNSNGFLAGTSDLQINRTRGFVYSTNGLPSTYTNALGLVVNLYWDNLLRLTGENFPADGTTTSNVYTGLLDVTAHKDRLGHWSSYTYDGLRHLTSITRTNNGNLTNTTLFGWCDCGALTSITNALNCITTLSYDYQDRLSGISFPDTSSLAYQYDLSGRMTQVQDGAGRYLNYGYNNQGLVTGLSNSYGTIASAVFDILDRPSSFTDANNVNTTFTYDMLNRLLIRTWTADGITKGFLYATNGLIAYTNRDSKITRFVRDTAGRPISITNANTELVQLAYDPAGNITNLIDGLTHNNGWGYNQFGWLISKADNSGNNSFRFYYDANGELTNRWTPGTTNTTYTYDALGNLMGISYPGAANPTLSVSFGYDLLNRLTNMIDEVGTTGWSYTSNGLVASEAESWTSSTVAYTYDQGHRTSLTLSQPTGGAWMQTNTYDNAWRLTGLSSPAGAFGYGYPASASTLIQNLSLPNAAYITNQYDYLARLTNTSLLNYWGHVLDGYGYAPDYLGLRKNISRYLGITTNNISATYDNIGQLISWSAEETSSTLRLNEQLGYGYDAADNLHLRTNNALVQTFTVDAFNELSTVGRSGNLTLSGNTPAPVTTSGMTVNGNVAQTNGDFTFAAASLSLANGNNSFTNIAINHYGVSSTNIFTVNLPTTVTFQYDTNGNLLNDGTRSFVYDAENQLTNAYVTNLWKSEFAYDGLRRRRIERDYTWSGGWVKTNETRYVYDGMLPIQERDTNNNPLVTYTRGADLNGSRQGAGGIGGLLARTDTNGSTFYHSDGAGNITALINGNQNIVARYEYDPFGKLIGKWGTMADVNHYRFSSKEVHALSGLYSYGFRFYDSSFQRWLNRDPIQEWGGVNMYGFVRNNPLTTVDRFGLYGANGEPEGPLEEGEQDIIDSAAWVLGQIDDGLNYMRQSENPWTRGIGAGLWGASWLWGGPEAKMVEETEALRAAEMMAAKAAEHIGGAGARDCIALTAERLAAALKPGEDNGDLINQLTRIVNDENIPGWQNAVPLMEQFGGLVAGSPVSWGEAGPGVYAVFQDGHVIYGEVPPIPLTPYLYDPQINKVLSADAVPSTAVAIPFTAAPK